MMADAPVTANISLRPTPASFVRLQLAAPQRQLLRLVLVYRWISLLPALWLCLTAQTAPVPAPLLLFLVAACGTLVVTAQSRSVNRTFVEVVAFLGIDLFCAAALLALGGQPYYWYALSPLLLGALLFWLRGALFAVIAFIALYLLALLTTSYTYPITFEPGQLLTQLTGIGLIPLIFGYPVALFKQHQQDQAALIGTQHDLLQQQVELKASHDQLEIIHDLTLLLQGAADIQSVQQRVLRVVSGELGFAQAVVGLVNPVAQSLGDWQTYPAQDVFLTNLPPLALTPENGFVTRKLLDRQGGWWRHEEPLVSDESLNAWLSQTPWLILPLILAEQPVGVLLVAVEGGPGSLSEDQLVILTAVASQAAVALGTIDRAQRLAAEQERNRIARDIHDTIAQSLFGMVFTLDACIKMLPQQAETVQQELGELRQLADQVRHEIRRYILDTWPSELTQEQFKADLNKYVAHFAPGHAFQIDFTINGDFDRLPSVIRRSLYRVSQEALANAARHAGVDSARLTMHVEPDEVYLSISDRGKGFEPKLALAREVNRERFGLRGIRERIQALGGRCDILSQAGQGAQVLVQLPVNRRHI